MSQGKFGLRVQRGVLDDIGSIHVRWGQHCAGSCGLWENLCNIVLVGNAFELVAAGLFVGTSTKLASLRAGAGMGEERRNEL